MKLITNRNGCIHTTELPNYKIPSPLEETELRIQSSESYSPAKQSSLYAIACKFQLHHPLYSYRMTIVQSNKYEQYTLYDWLLPSTNRH